MSNHSDVITIFYVPSRMTQLELEDFLTKRAHTGVKSVEKVSNTSHLRVTFIDRGMSDFLDWHQGNVRYLLILCNYISLEL